MAAMAKRAFIVGTTGTGGCASGAITLFAFHERLPVPNGRMAQGAHSVVWGLRGAERCLFRKGQPVID